MLHWKMFTLSQALGTKTEVGLGDMHPPPHICVRAFTVPEQKVKFWKDFSHGKLQCT